MTDEYFVSEDDAQRGPFTLLQLQSMWRSGAITARSLYWQHGFEEWLPISDLAESLNAAKPAQLSAATRMKLATEPEPPTAGVAVVTFLIPLVGIITGLVWMSGERPRRRAAGGSILTLGIILLFAYAALIFAIRLA